MVAGAGHHDARNYDMRQMCIRDRFRQILGIQKIGL